jgi:hypothetical protein
MNRKLISCHGPWRIIRNCNLTRIVIYWPPLRHFADTVLCMHGSSNNGTASCTTNALVRPSPTPSLSQSNRSRFTFVAKHRSRMASWHVRKVLSHTYIILQHYGVTFVLQSYDWNEGVDEKNSMVQLTRIKSDCAQIVAFAAINLGPRSQLPILMTFGILVSPPRSTATLPDLWMMGMVCYQRDCRKHGDFVHW